jgi:hypothetical protein
MEVSSGRFGHSVNRELCRFMNQHSTVGKAEFGLNTEADSN